MTKYDQFPTADADDRILADIRQAGDMWVHMISERITEAEDEGHGYPFPVHVEVVYHLDEMYRDQVRIGDSRFYRVEATGEWHQVGWSDAGRDRLRRSRSLSYLARVGAVYLAEHPGPTHRDEIPELR